jgi:NADPH-dependent glutamate synthase beta subunit-like oxidoreductase/NAD-dependent dihydropyrimidine dehydrogenase PreA subunit
MTEYPTHPDTIWPPCSDACPAGTDVRGYLDHIAHGRYIEAFELIRSVNPFGSACGRICPHACEEKCRRNDVDDPLAARALKRFAYETVKEYRRKHRSTPDIPLGTTGKRIAIVGAGPSGLTAARDLALRGHTVEVFEREEKAGGMLMNAIPNYRLPPEAIQEDINAILGLKIKLHTGQCLGKDFAIDGLKSDGFDAVIIAIGLQESHTLPLPGIDAENVLLALPFLRDLSRGEQPKIGSNVIVVGGGNVAIDVARSARRIGAEKVVIVCLESMDILPASPWEVEEAMEEGVELHPSWGPECIETADGEVCGLTCKSVKSVFDEEGRFAPTFHEDQLTSIEGDTVILAIGQRANMDWAEGTDIDYQGFRLIVDPDTLKTSSEGVFACGEVASGPGSAIQAVAHGKKAAKIVDNYLKTGRVEPFRKEEREVIGRLDDIHAQRIQKEKRQQIKLFSAEERLKGFMEYEKVFTEEEAMLEARRCLHCGLGAQLITSRYCAACLTCLRICPFGVPEMKGQRVSFPEEFCVACGVCATMCPGRAIEVRRFPEDRLEVEINEFFNKAKDGVVRFSCNQGVTTKKALEAKDAVYLDCLGSLSDLDLLKTLSMGASEIILKVPENYKCKCNQVLEMLIPRVESLNERLTAAKIDKKIIFEDMVAK